MLSNSKQNITLNPPRSRDASIAVVMITLNEAHNLRAVLENISGWANEIFIVDSCSSDETVDIALEFGVHVVQRRFRGFGDQWNFALENLPIKCRWTMKLDPDERLTEDLKRSIDKIVVENNPVGIFLDRRLWFMGKALPVRQRILRLWQTGACKFSDVLVNEYPRVRGECLRADGYLEHFDSPNLHHWFEKQNLYSSKEAIAYYENHELAIDPKFFGSNTQRRMWFKKKFWKFPFRYFFLFVYHYVFKSAWVCGRVGWIWAHLRTDSYRNLEYKRYEIKRIGRAPVFRPASVGRPDPRVNFFD